MTRKIPLTLALAALVGFAAPALAAEPTAAKHDPQAASTTAKPKATPTKEAKKAVKGRHHARASKASASSKTPAAQPAPSAQ